MFTKTSIPRLLILLGLTLVLLIPSRSSRSQDKTQASDNQTTTNKSTPPDKQTTPPATTSQSEQKFQFELTKSPAGLFHLVVKQPGPLAVTVTGALAKGDGVKVELLGPGNMPLLTGDLNAPINYTVTAADLKRGTGWLVRVLPKRRGAANSKPTAPAPTQRFVFMPGRSKKSNFSFTVARPGPITVDVRANLHEQSPLLLRLQGPHGEPTLTGSLDSTLNYTVTQDDLSRGRYWTVQIVAAPKPIPSTIAKAGSTSAEKPSQPATEKSSTKPATKTNPSSTAKHSATANVKPPTAPEDKAGSQKIQLSVAHNHTGFFSFTITKPGPVSIEITGSAKPQPVHITGPKNSPALTGTTAKPISYTVTAADLKRGEFWTAQVTMPKK